jgi:glycosyltransferase involved in cell wall biosynthesis
MKTKLLVVTSTFPRWKSDTDPPFVYELSKRLTSDFDIIVHTPHCHGSLTQEIMDGMRIHRFRYFFSYFERLAGGQGIVPKLRRNKLYYLLLPFFLSAQFCSLFLLVATVKPDVIHAHWLIPQGLLAVLMKRFYGIPVVVTAHGTDVVSLRQGVFIWLKKHTVNYANRIVTVSKSLATILDNDTSASKEINVISMGVDAVLFSPQHRNNALREQYNICGTLLLFVGRLTEIKGVRHLLDAMVLVVAEIPDIKLLIVGHGELEEDLKKQVAHLGLQENVCFNGCIPNEQLPQYYATADIFISPSIRLKNGGSEGFGLTFVEAAMSGCFLIGTKTGGIEDIIIDEKTGFLVPPEDASALAGKILFVIRNLGDLDDMRMRGRAEIIKKFEWGSISKKYSLLLLKLICKNVNKVTTHRVSGKS